MTTDDDFSKFAAGLVAARDRPPVPGSAGRIGPVLGTTHSAPRRRHDRGFPAAAVDHSRACGRRGDERAGAATVLASAPRRDAHGLPAGRPARPRAPGPVIDVDLPTLPSTALTPTTTMSWSKTLPLTESTSSGLDSVVGMRTELYGRTATRSFGRSARTFCHSPSVMWRRRASITTSTRRSVPPGTS